MFCVGLEFRLGADGPACAASGGGVDRRHRRARSRSAALLALVLMRSGGFFAPGVQTFQAVLFVGAAMSITAFPMLARIIYERGIAGTALGTLALAAGAIDDAVAWIILAVVLGSFTGSSDAGGGRRASGGLLYVMGVLVAAAAAAACGWMRSRRTRARLPPWMLAAMLVGAGGFGAWFTELVGIYAVFGAFVLGAAIPRGLLSRELQRRIEPLTTALLVPLFFVYSGLNSQIGLVNSGLALGGDGAGVRRRLRSARASPAGPPRAHRGVAARSAGRRHADERTRHDGADPAQHRPAARPDHADAVHDPRDDGDRHDADGRSALQPGRPRRARSLRTSPAPIALGEHA